MDYECVYIEYDNLNCNSTGKMLKRNKVLTSLNVMSCDIGPVGLSELCSALEVNTTLTSLNLSNFRIDHRRVDRFGKLLIITVAVMTVSEEVFEAHHGH